MLVSVAGGELRMGVITLDGYMLKVRNVAFTKIMTLFFRSDLEDLWDIGDAQTLISGKEEPAMI